MISRTLARTTIRLALFAVAAMSLATVTAEAETSTDEISLTSESVAVARPNFRAFAAYDYTNVESDTSSVESVGFETILSLGEEETQSVALAFIGTLPLTSHTGARGFLRGGYVLSQITDDLIGFTEHEGFERYGAGIDLFARDPEIGSFTVGGAFDRFDFNDGFNGNEIGGSVEAVVFFPAEAGAIVDWKLGFEFSQIDYSGPGLDVENEVDTIGLVGTGSWYATENFIVELGGEWARFEPEFQSEEFRGGTLGIRGLLPIPVSTELFLEGSVGESEFKAPPFPPNERLDYSIRIGLQIRMVQGQTLLSLRRRYD